MRRAADLRVPGLPIELWYSFQSVSSSSYSSLCFLSKLISRRLCSSHMRRCLSLSIESSSSASFLAERLRLFYFRSESSWSLLTLALLSSLIGSSSRSSFLRYYLASAIDSSNSDRSSRSALYRILSSTDRSASSSSKIRVLSH